MLRVIEEQAAAQGYRKVVAVSLEVGALAGVEVEALRFGFDVVMKDSIAEGARLDVTVRPALAWCDACSRRVEVAQRFKLLEAVVQIEKARLHVGRVLWVRKAL